MFECQSGDCVNAPVESFRQASAFRVDGILISLRQTAIASKFFLHGCGIMLIAEKVKLNLCSV